MGLDRRKFLQLSALGATATPALLAGEKVIQKSDASFKRKYPKSVKKRTVCTHCSIGCGIVAEVDNGVWVRQEAAFEHPVNTGGHCCKGADMIDKVRSETRLRYPIEKVAGKWQRTTYTKALDKVCEQLKDIREKHGPDSVMIIGSAKLNNEQSYYIRKFAAFMGTNNIDHQARI